MPNATFVDSALLVNWLRLVKSDVELKAMSEAGRITDRVVERFFEMVEPGVRECDVAAEVARTQLAFDGGYAGGCPITVGMLAAAERSASGHLPWTDRPYRTGDVVFLETGAQRHRYHCPLARSMYLGSPPQPVVDVGNGVVEGIESALAAAKPGNVCEDVEAAWRNSISRYGLTKESRIGYAVGIGYPPDWGEHTASLRAGDRTEMQPNMAFHMVCGMWQEGWGIVISETFRITETGAETFSVLPRGLHVKT